MSDPSIAFHQAVLVIVPALLFGGMLSGAIEKPDRRERPKRWRAWLYLFALGVAPTFIMVSALLGVLGADAGAPNIVASSLYVLGATAFIGLKLAWPWIGVLHHSRAPKVALIVVGAVAPVVWASIQMPSMIGLMERIQKSEAILRDTAQTDRRVDAVIAASTRRFAIRREAIKLSYLRGEIDRNSYLRELTDVNREAKRANDVEHPAFVEAAMKELDWAEADAEEAKP